MAGGIYTRQKCPECSVVMRDNHRNAVICPECGNHHATRFIVKFGKVFKNYSSYIDAQRELTGMRYNIDHGIFDERDYQKNKPLSFEHLTDRWLQKKKNSTRPGTYQHYKSYMKSACNYFGLKTNIKKIGYSELEDFFDDLHVTHKLSSKTVHNIKSALHSFFTWVSLRENKGNRFYEIPDFPKINYTLGYRKLVDKDTQQAIIAKVKDLTYHLNPKIWLGIKWLATYVSIRPGAMYKLTEYEVNAKTGYFHVPSSANKEGVYKTIPMLPEDRQIIMSLPSSIDLDLPFFRHIKGMRGVNAGVPFGVNIFYKWWKRACREVCVEGVDLYGGTKHSTVTALRKKFSPEQIKRYGTQHATNKAFDRYFQVDLDESLEIYTEASGVGSTEENVATVLQLKQSCSLGVKHE